MIPKLGYNFKNPALLKQALTHSSYVYENRTRNIKMESNERLELLGDAVLELCVSDLLFMKYPCMKEGELSKLRAKLVCEQALAGLARDIDLGEYLFLGSGERESGGRDKCSILADALEAVTGAIYIDGGFEAVKELIARYVWLNIDELKSVMDYKTTLQEYLQKKGCAVIKYMVIEERGVPHNKTFVSAVYHDDKLLGQGSGKSKKESEQNAAKAALEKIKP